MKERDRHVLKGGSWQGWWNRKIVDAKNQIRTNGTISEAIPDYYNKRRISEKQGKRPRNKGLPTSGERPDRDADRQMNKSNNGSIEMENNANNAWAESRVYKYWVLMFFFRSSWFYWLHNYILHYLEMPIHYKFF